MAVTTDGNGAVRPQMRAGTLVNAAGAIVSVALIGGLGIWGWRLMVRDATGIPVVQAMDGPMREAPASPGGEVAPNVGLSVNAIPAEGAAAPTEERLVLAPQLPALTEEDLLHQPTAEADELRAGDLVPEDEVEAEAAADDAVRASVSVPQDGRAMTAEEVLALADQIAAGAAPAGPAGEGAADAAPVEAAALAAPAAPAEAAAAPADAAIEAAVAQAAAPAIEVIDAGTPGVARALRPPTRPVTLTTATAVAAVEEPAAAAEPRPLPVRTEALPAGTILVQLGAFDSVGLAEEEWEGIAGRFAEFMEGREALVQEAVSGGSTFYRLRAVGFGTLADARRFCAALVAEGTDCIPVVSD